ncbi:asparagine synthase-related protein [Aquibacillus albus]|uniref:asparagine synthase (glutamine-hydrolyzing) n=1 Tax=Aquibacillus albus TaxID=1168171 RepID=A0ABS2N5S7_9BACI|nr:asparagine synthase-related protein [Aquibacillus albus]MBM7573491.1 asparagine synthase (glutamine-hydrolyzing) [Aquibacillus albus]
MSAITGIYHKNKQPVPEDHLTGMMDALSKYPADDARVWKEESIILGCHAQWITPESIGEPLPYYDPERQMAITADAIIDNRQELFEILQVGKAKRDYMPDSMLLLLAYCKWGEDMPQHILGDFAFMIWDERNNQLFGARDFSGMRSLYFFHDVERFAFCTTIAPLFRLPYINKQLNENWLAEYLAIPDVIDTVDDSITAYQSIEQLPPSHSITVKGDSVTISRYQALDFNKQIRFSKDEEYVEAFREVFQQAVDARLRTLGPVGVQLSGGLDSGAVVSFAAKSNKQLYTYSYTPEENFTDWTPGYAVADERPFIRDTVSYVGNMKEHFLSLNGMNPYAEMDDWLDIMEAPYKFFENSFWLKGTYEKASSQGVRMLLNGARGNFTISWGRALEYYSRLLKKMRWLSLYRELGAYSKNINVRKSLIFSVIGKKAFLNKSKSSDPFPSIIHPEFARRMDIFSKLREMDAVSQLSVSEIRKKHFENTYVWNTTGTTATKLSLRYGAWNRDPTNDLRVVQFCLAIPEDQFVKNGCSRALIRRATEGYLPDSVRLNQRVRGMQAADWVHRMAPDWNAFVSELTALVDDPICASYLNIDLLKTFLPKVKNGPQSEYAFDPEIRVLMRALIVYRYLKRGGDSHEKRMEAARVGGS